MSTGNATDMEHLNNAVATDLVYQSCYWHAAVKYHSSAIFKSLRRRAVLHRHRIATSLCILLPLFKYFVWTGYNHFHTSQHSKALVDTGSCAQLGLQMMCSWWKSYLVCVGAVQVHNHHPDSYLTHQTLFSFKCFRKVSKKKGK